MSTIRQRRWGYRTEFTFEDDSVNFQFKGPADGRSFTFGYETLIFEQSDYIVRRHSDWFRYGYLVFLLCALTMFSGYVVWMIPAFAFGLLVAIVMIIAQTTSWFDVGITRIPSVAVPGGLVLIIENDSQDVILSRLRSGRLVRLKDLLGPVNMENGPAAERAKFEWLRQQDVIDATEYDQAIAQVSAYERLADGKSNTLN